jgi:branched-chain amino acid transport system substrate-binding protein
VRRFEERYGRSPDAFAAQGYAGIQILVAAARSGGGTSRQAITEGLRRLGEVETVLGTLSFADNEAVYPASIQEYVADRFELLQRGSS